MHTLLNIALFSVAVFIVSSVLPSIKIKNYGTALVVAVVYSVINFLVGWLLRLLALPFIFITFGLFTFVVNAVLLWITDKLIEDYEIDGVLHTLLAAFLITLLNSGIQKLLF